MPEAAAPREVRAGQVYLLPDGREIFVRTNPAMGTVRGRGMLSVDTVTERINRSSVKRFAKLELIGENRCYGCWRTGSDEGHTPPDWALADHERVRDWRQALKAKWAAERAAKRATGQPPTKP